jgi:hypothetical protein
VTAVEDLVEPMRASLAQLDAELDAKRAQVAEAERMRTRLLTALAALSDDPEHRNLLADALAAEAARPVSPPPEPPPPPDPPGAARERLETMPDRNGRGPADGGRVRDVVYDAVAEVAARDGWAVLDKLVPLCNTSRHAVQQQLSFLVRDGRVRRVGMGRYVPADFGDRLATEPPPPSPPAPPVRIPPSPDQQRRRGRPISQHRQAILDALAHGPRTVDELARRVGCTVTTARNQLHRLRDDGKVRQAAGGQSGRWMLADTGPGVPLDQLGPITKTRIDEQAARAASSE